MELRGFARFVILPPADSNIEHSAPAKPPLRDDTRFAAGRIAVFQYAAVAVLLFLISGFWTLQIQNEEFYGKRAQQNSIKAVPILAPRGRLLDRDGRVIVDNHTSFTLILARELMKEEHLAGIAQGLDLDLDDLTKQVARVRKQPKYVPIVLKEELTPADLSFVESHRDFYPELVLIDAQRRLYPQNGMLAHLVGYTGQVSEADLETPEFAKYQPGDVVGKVGIERQYNSILMGVDGQRQVVVDYLGRVREELARKPAIPGKDLQLTIDLDLQVVAELAMEGKKGAVVALDPRTGDVLAMVSRPTFDPNRFAVRVKMKNYWKEILDNPDNPLLNRAIQSQLAPGSTFKPIMALAGLETGTIDEKFTASCPGGATFYGHYFRCWVKRGHGRVALHDGVKESCDVYFYTIGNKMGINNIAMYAELAGLGKKSGIDLPAEASGTVPSEKWKLRNYRQKWYAGETISVSIGQGALTVSPLQLARAVCGIAVGGTWHHPHVTMDARKTEKPDEWKLNPENVKAVVDGMYGVVNEGGGTGGRAWLPNVEVCGKTGTAQLASNDLLKTAGNDMKDNAWFVAFAPRVNPEIAVAVLFESGLHGALSAPVAKDVLKAYFDKKVRVAALQEARERLSGKMAAIGGLGLPQAAPGNGPAGVPQNQPAAQAPPSGGGEPAQAPN
jgi:penicillin-binding protein 2